MSNDALCSYEISLSLFYSVYCYNIPVCINAKVQMYVCMYVCAYNSKTENMYICMCIFVIVVKLFCIISLFIIIYFK